MKKSILKGIFIGGTAVLVDLFYAAAAFASTAGGPLAAATGTVTQTVNGYAKDGEYILYAIAGISAVIGIGEYVFAKEHKKTIEGLLGTAVGTGVVGTIVGAFSSSSTGSGAVVTAAKVAYKVAATHLHIS